MKKKGLRVFLLVIACIYINFSGCLLARHFELPVWLDSIGTLVMAYLYGPVCGAIVGASSNLITSVYLGSNLLYLFTSVAIGLIVGFCQKKDMFKDLFGAFTVSFLVTIASVVISAPLNYIYHEGFTGNVWGDGVIRLLLSWKWHPALCFTIGQLYVDFFDKVFIIMAGYVIIRIYRRAKNGTLFAFIHRKQAGPAVDPVGESLNPVTVRDAKGEGKPADRLKSVLLLLLAAGMVFTQMPFAVPASAETGDTPAERSAPMFGGSSFIPNIYNSSNGIPGSAVNDIVQGQDGVLWIGTYSGLYRYNGTSFQRKESLNAVRNVNCFIFDEEGRLWIGTNDSGVFLCIHEEVSNIIDKTEGLPSDSVRCIAENADGDYYIGTTDRLAIISLDSGISVTDTLDDVQFAESMDADKRGYVALVTADGQLMLLREKKVVYRLDSSAIKGNYSCCSFDEDGLLYVGTTENQVLVYDVLDDRLALRHTVSTGELSHINSLDVSEKNYIIVCADNGAGYMDTKRTFYEVNMNEFSNSIERAIVDYQGNIWFASSRLGLLEFCRSKFTQIYSEIGLEKKVVNAVTKWRGDLYYGTDIGLDMSDGDATVIKENALTEALRDVRIRSMMVDSRDNLWICTSKGGVYQVQSEDQYKVYDTGDGILGKKFRMALETKDGTVMVAGDSGISYIRDGKVIRTLGEDDHLVNPKTLCLFEMPDGSILAGTDGDGIEVIRDGHLVGHFDKSDGLTSGVVMRMVRDSARNGIYIVTGNGLCYMDEEGRIRSLENFPYYNNFDLVEGTDGELFVMTSGGIYIVDREDLLKGEKLDYTLMNYEHGFRESLTANAWNYLDENGNLYLSTNAGVMGLNIHHYKKDFRSYRMRIAELLVDNVHYRAEQGSVIKVAHGAELIEIVPEIINYSLDNPYISIYLEGYDAAPKIMHLSDIRNVIYANLASGMYTFHLSVLDDNGDVVAESVYKIEKEKEIYENWWFIGYVIIVTVLLALYLAWMLFRTQLQKTLKIQKRELELARKQVELGNEAILTIAQTVDAKDVNTSQHSMRVSEYSIKIAERLGYNQEQLEKLRKTALLHDIGKIGIPDSILNKPSRLTDEEYTIMKSHVVKGAEILKNFSMVDNIAEGAKYHHERYDGRGYMMGLKGEEIPLNARIIGIADAFDAMTANRVYRDKLDFDYVLGELKRGRGTQFDPHLVDIMLELIEDGSIQVDRD